MVKARWVKTVGAALTCVGLSWGQQPPSPSLATVANGAIVAVPELGKDQTGQDRKFQLLRSWKQPDGKTIFELKELESGERIIVIEPNVAAAGQPPKRSIFSWGKDEKNTSAYATAPAPSDQVMSYQSAPTGEQKRQGTLTLMPSAFESSPGSAPVMTETVTSAPAGSYPPGAATTTFGPGSTDLSAADHGIAQASVPASAPMAAPVPMPSGQVIMETPMAAPPRRSFFSWGSRESTSAHPVATTCVTPASCDQGPPPGEALTPQATIPGPTTMPGEVIVETPAPKRRGFFSRKETEPTYVPQATVPSGATLMPAETVVETPAPKRRGLFFRNRDNDTPVASTVPTPQATIPQPPQPPPPTPVIGASVGAPNVMEQQPVMPPPAFTIPAPSKAPVVHETNPAPSFVPTPPSGSMFDTPKATFLPPPKSSVPDLPKSPLPPKTTGTIPAAEPSTKAGPLSLPGFGSGPPASPIPTTVGTEPATKPVSDKATVDKPAVDKPIPPKTADSAWEFARETEKTQIKVESTQPKKDWTAAPETSGLFDKPASAEAPKAGEPGKPPLGSRSVMSAGGKPGAIMYVPVPMMTMPQVQKAPTPPQAPAAQIPQPPKAPILPGTVDEANAFTTPRPPTVPVKPEPGVTGVANAFSAPVQDNGEGGAFMPRNGGSAPQMAQGYPMPYGPTGQQGMYPPQNRYPTPNGGMMMAQGYPAPYYGQMPPQGYPMPYGGMPPAQGAYPPAYNQMAQQPRPAQGMAPSQGVPSRADIQTASYNGSKSSDQPSDEIARQLMRILQDSLYPSERERAADNLSTRDWHTNPQVVDALVKCAQEDPAATVRAACVHGLAKMEVNTVPVMNALQLLKTDADPRVRKEVEQALAGFRPH